MMLLVLRSAGSDSQWKTLAPFLKVGDVDTSLLPTSRVCQSEIGRWTVAIAVPTGWADLAEEGIYSRKGVLVDNMIGLGMW